MGIAPSPAPPGKERKGCKRLHTFAGSPILPAMTQDFDPLAPEDFDSPHVEYAHLRRECPVAHSNAWGGFWALMKYEDVVRAATDSDL